MRRTAIIPLFLPLVLLCSCRTQTKYVPVESVRTEYRDREVERVTADTVTDIRFVFVKGDTVIDYRDRVRVNRVEIRDTCYMERVDTIRTPYPVERPLTKWEQVKMETGGWAIGTGSVLLVALVAVIVWLIKVKRKK